MALENEKLVIRAINLSILWLKKKRKIDDADDYDAVLDEIKDKDKKAAIKIFNLMDKSARDVIVDKTIVRDKTLRQAASEFFGIKAKESMTKSEIILQKLSDEAVVHGFAFKPDVLQATSIAVLIARFIMDHPREPRDRALAKLKKVKIPWKFDPNSKDYNTVFSWIQEGVKNAILKALAEADRKGVLTGAEDVKDIRKRLDV